MAMFRCFVKEPEESFIFALAQLLSWEVTEFRNGNTESFKNFEGVFIDIKKNQF